MTRYIKLKSGNLGLKSDTLLRDGDTVTVTKKDGDTRMEVVGTVLCSGDTGCIATIKKLVPRGSSELVCAECGRAGRLVADLEDGLLKHIGCCYIPA